MLGSLPPQMSEIVQYNREKQNRKQNYQGNCSTEYPGSYSQEKTDVLTWSCAMHGRLHKSKQAGTQLVRYEKRNPGRQHVTLWYWEILNTATERYWILHDVCQKQRTEEKVDCPTCKKCDGLMMWRTMQSWNAHSEATTKTSKYKRYNFTTDEHRSLAVNTNQSSL